MEEAKHREVQVYVRASSAMQGPNLDEQRRRAREQVECDARNSTQQRSVTIVRRSRGDLESN